MVNGIVTIALALVAIWRTQVIIRLTQKGNQAVSQKIDGVNDTLYGGLDIAQQKIMQLESEITRLNEVIAKHG